VPVTAYIPQPAEVTVGISIIDENAQRERILSKAYPLTLGDMSFRCDYEIPKGSIFELSMNFSQSWVPSQSLSSSDERVLSCTLKSIRALPTLSVAR
jgi:hypothetical protein